MTSAAAVVVDSAPVVTSVTISPANPTTNQLLTANVSASDADGDAISYSYVWNRNGTPIAGQTGSTLDLSAASNGDAGDAISVTVTPSDGTLSGAAATSAAAVVVETAPVVISVTISPANPTTNQMLTANVNSSDADGDAITYSYVWNLNGTPIAGQTGSTLDLSLPGNGDRGERSA